MAETSKTRELFLQYMRLRQGGDSLDDAWHSIEEIANILLASERERLVKMLRNWEIAEKGADEAFVLGLFEMPDKLTAQPVEMPVSSSAQPVGMAVNAYPSAPPVEVTTSSRAQPVEKRNVIRRIQPGEKSITQPVTVECPNCHKANQPGTLHCYSCGTLLLKAPPPPGATQPLAPGTPTVDSAFFGEKWVLSLKVQGAGDAMRVQPRQSDTILGRRSLDSVMVPDVDLSPYGASEKGVSRLHASVRRQEQTLVLSDLGSINHTYLNGQLLHVHEVRVLHDGDEIRLGRLVINAYFHEA